MSSDESNADGVPTNDMGRESSGSEDDASEQIVKRKKKLIRRKLPWRSQEPQAVIENLNRKIERRRTDQAKAICLEIRVDGNSERLAPHDAPEWAVELFS